MRSRREGYQPIYENFLFWIKTHLSGQRTSMNRSKTDPEDWWKGQAGVALSRATAPRLLFALLSRDPPFFFHPASKSDAPAPRPHKG